MTFLKRICLLAGVISSFQTSAQDSLVLTRSECENRFLNENLLLLAKKLDVPIAEAKVLQAKLWPNPTLTFDQVNFWATKGQTGGQENIPPLGPIRANQQFAFEIEQVLLTAGKRKKLVALEGLNVEKSVQYFEEILRSLKVEFRNNLTKLQYLQLSKSIYQNQIGAIQQLTKTYQQQVEKGNIARGEYIRLKALELGIFKNINELDKESNEVQKELKQLMHVPANIYLKIIVDDYFKDKNTSESLVQLIDEGKSNRPDVKLASLEHQYYRSLLSYEKAQRVPNLSLKTNYDRGGSAMFNFIGFGAAMDLPFFNRNQGNVKVAQVAIEQAKIEEQFKLNTVENEIALAYQNLKVAIDFKKNIEPNYEQNLDNLLSAYTKNFTNRNISMLEYLDFLDAYLENKKIILEAAKAVQEKAEELNYSLGKDLIK